ncbi:hypothetical protein BKA62DRAFT_830668 [Auriculariales sp. MPI-PUGE-AT-0066]|nr:hypothetical protein BKA62DRAFT_830668 [Auriculariales sp. MPI-PUGE-AT-0066]
MAMNLLRALNSSYGRARPMLASALRGPTHAAIPRLSSVSANPIICSPRLFSGFAPAPSPTTNSNPTTGVDNVYQQPTNEIQGLVEEGPTKSSAASPEHTSASPDHERVQESKLTSAEKLDEAKLEELRAELLALPESPQGAISEYGCFMRHFKRTFAITGESESPKATDMWKALSDTERQQFKAEADINQLRLAEYDEWVQAVGSTSLRQINRNRVLSGKEKLRIPTSLRRVRKSPNSKTFLEAKVASGEISTGEGLSAARKHALKLWSELDPSEQAIYETQSMVDYRQRLAARSRA